jgi:hypothetical protein
MKAEQIGWGTLSCIDNPSGQARVASTVRPGLIAMLTLISHSFDIRLHSFDILFLTFMLSRLNVCLDG